MHAPRAQPHPRKKLRTGSPLTKISAKGLLPTNLHGLVTISLALLLKLPPSVFLPLAFSIIPLSIIVITGATSAPAAPAASASTPTLSPSLCVFHLRAGSAAMAVFAASDGVGTLVGRGTGGALVVVGSLIVCAARYGGRKMGRRVE